MASEERKAFMLRIDAALWRELDAWAQEDLRSVNGQIEYLLREAARKRRGEASFLRKVDRAGGSKS